MKIFVQIASYRDPELLPTIRDCINKAKYPENLTFGICWQRDETETLQEYLNDDRFRILDYHWSESKGLCWARSEIQKLWKGEEYTLQLDSHHRFLKNWDEELIEMMNMTGSKKPIISTYAGMYQPSDDKLLNFEPYKMVASNFTPGGTILFRPHAIPNWETLEKPIPARFVSGHFFFTIGKHCEEYKYDPNIYFAGDEISLSIRSYTLGYDLFHPHYTVIWHEYTREGRTKHWTDFDTENKEAGLVEKPWWEMDNESKRRLRHMLQEEDNGIDLGEYGLGNVRSHYAYEEYAGINFRRRKLHPNAVKGIDPPTYTIDDDFSWMFDVEELYNLTLDWTERWPELRAQTRCTCTFDFLYVGVESEDGEVLYRQDLTQAEYLNGQNTTLPITISSVKKPIKFIVWPHQKDKDWLERIDIAL